MLKFLEYYKDSKTKKGNMTQYLREITRDQDERKAHEERIILTSCCKEPRSLNKCYTLQGLLIYVYKLDLLLLHMYIRMCLYKQRNVHFKFEKIS